ncbi:MAG TPA: hypothetical protein VMW29_02250 [Candidatus Bathyarchaeia archaeon]|nr:hypothetical protein [Candidatus Bathyarchaeia archaeon]
MAKQKPTLNQADFNLLKKTFSTKDDLNNGLKPIKSDLKTLKSDVKNIDIRLVSVEKDVKGIDTRLKSVEKDVKKIKKDTSYTADYLDKNMIKFDKRTKRLENHLHLPVIPELDFI